MPDRFNATAIACSGRAALICGASGTGKSDLALRCLAVAPNALIPVQAQLVSDDYVVCERVGAGLAVSPPDALVGKIEVRGVGIMTVPYEVRADAAIVVELTDAASIVRFPDPPEVRDLFGVQLPVLRVNAFEASAPLKVLLALYSEWGR